MKKIIMTLVLFAIFSDCSKLLEPEGRNPVYSADIEEIYEIVNAYYPFLELKKIDWDSLYDTYKPLVENARGDEALSILSQLIYELKDSHAQLYNEYKYALTRYKMPRARKDEKAFDPLVVRKYFPNSLKISGYFEYQILPDNLGYLYIASFIEEGQWDQNFELALNYLKNSKGLIIDIRHNGGGSTITAYYFLKRLISSPLKGVLWTNKGGGYNPIETFYPNGSFQYTKPIVLLINGVSYSTSDTFANLLKKVAHVTVIGDTTGGGGGNPEIIQLPSGLKFRVPTRCEMRYDGEHLEWNGVPPDVLVPQKKEDIENNIDKQLAYAINYLNQTIN